MFSKYKKTPTKAPEPKPEKAVLAPVTDIAAANSVPKGVTRKQSIANSAAVAPLDKERKRKERLGEIKLELHQALLDNLNLAALEHASESDLRSEINSIASEILEEK